MRRCLTLNALTREVSDGSMLPEWFGPPGDRTGTAVAVPTIGVRYRMPVPADR